MIKLFFFDAGITRIWGIKDKSGRCSMMENDGSIRQDGIFSTGQYSQFRRQAYRRGRNMISIIRGLF